MLVRYKGNQQLYAMKTLRKEALVRRKQLMHTSTERYILQNISQLILKLFIYTEIQEDGLQI